VEVALLQLRQHAPEYERYGPKTFAKAIGTRIPFRTGLGMLRGGVVLTEAEVAKDGSYVDFTLEVPTAVAALMESGLLS
jgi:hypothetical protein